LNLSYSGDISRKLLFSLFGVPAQVNIYMIFHQSLRRDGCGMDSFDIMMVALRFNEKINERALEGLVELMTDDRTFIDNSGDMDRNMKEGWREFFENYPDYVMYSLL